jgi:hypothetical protein
MADYRGSTEDGVIRTADDVFIARNLDNPDWQAFLAWQQAGGVLDPAIVAPPPYEWYIDIGPFFDRFGSAKMAVLTSTNVVAKAIVTDCMVRKWIDLQNPAVAAGIDALISVGVSGVDAALKTSILTTPVLPAEQSAVVRMYFTNM